MFPIKETFILFNVKFQIYYGDKFSIIISILEGKSYYRDYSRLV